MLSGYAFASIHFATFGLLALALMQWVWREKSRTKSHAELQQQQYLLAQFGRVGSNWQLLLNPISKIYIDWTLTLERRLSGFLFESSQWLEVSLKHFTNEVGAIVENPSTCWSI